jgi:hypothetical protein
MLVASLPAVAAEADTRVLDDFSDPGAWQASASDEVRASVARAPQGGLCLRYDFGRVSGYAVLRRALALELPPHYALRLRLRGTGAPNALQLKLLDASGDNVWWLNRPDYVPPRTSTELVVRQRQIEFAWGPTADRTLTRAAAIELVVASGQGGRGELCFERLALRTLPAPGPLPTPVTRWQAVPAPSWQVDFGVARELNGVLLRWPDGTRTAPFALQASDDGRRWRTLRGVRGGTRTLLPLWLPETETRFLRLAFPHGTQSRQAPTELRAIAPQDWPARNDMLAALARASPRGRFPRAFVGEQNYWTLVGVDGGADHAALISEDGAIEPHRGGPSLEPFVIDEAGRMSTWADVRIEQSLREGYLPLPEVRWSGPGFALRIEAGAEGTRERSRLIARYTVSNTQARARTLTLALALRPWQVNPPRQFLNTPGGVSPVRQVAWQRGTLQVDGRAWLHAATPPDAAGAAPFDAGDALELAARGAPLAVAVRDDAAGLASAVLRWRLRLAPGESRSVALVLPLVGATTLAEAAEAAGGGTVEARLDAIAAAWRARLNRVALNLPPAAQPLVDTLRSALAQILLSRDGPALRPGTRSYARSWIRDGAMMVAGLLRLGEVDASREFVQWYAGHLFSNGKVPCCVDARGADPVAENDSHGQFIHAVALLWRHTRDRALLESLWPKVDGAARYMERLRQSERSGANRQPGREAFFGLMPASISHEGYSAKPMHSYWDDFWALAGYRDAAQLARTLGHDARAAELAAQQREFAAELGTSITAAVRQHRIDHLPGAAELGDFDPSSSTLIFSPAGAETTVPRALLESTWERYWRESVARRDGQRDWSDYTPYELRSVSAFVRLGQAERAHAMLEFFLRDRRPAAWNQWAEVVGRLPREPRFVGDMPHAWISSDYLRAVLDLLAFERESDGALVLGAGVPAAWWRAGPVELRALRTSYGSLDLRIALEGERTLRVTLVAGLERPPGGVWLAWPGPGTPPAATTVQGRPLAWQGRLLALPEGGVDLRLQLAPERE